MSLWKPLKMVAATAVVLSVPAFAVYGLMASSSNGSQLSTDFHVLEPVNYSYPDQAAGSLNPVEEVDLRAYAFAYGKRPPPIPVTK